MQPPQSRPSLHRGEVWWVRFDPAEGSEISKTRPAVVMTAPGMGRLPLAIVVPITDWKTHYTQLPWFVHLVPTATNGLRKESGQTGFR